MYWLRVTNGDSLICFFVVLYVAWATWVYSPSGDTTRILAQYEQCGHDNQAVHDGQLVLSIPFAQLLCISDMVSACAQAVRRKAIDMSYLTYLCAFAGVIVRFMCCQIGYERVFIWASDGVATHEPRVATHEPRVATHEPHREHPLWRAVPHDVHEQCEAGG
jgi:hypothetical protein